MGNKNSLRKADDLFKMNNFAKSMKIYEEIYQKNMPLTADILVHLAMCHVKTTENFQKANQLY